MPRWTPRVTVAAIATHNERYLMVQETIDGHRVLNQPAGHLESGESVIDAIVREVDEETGLVFTPIALIGIYRWQMTQDTTFLRFLFGGDVDIATELAPKDPIIDAAIWLTENEIRAQTPRLRSPQVLQGLDDYIQGHRFPIDCLRDIV